MAWKLDYATSNELKSYLRISDTVDDAQIATVLTTASRAIDSATRRQFGRLDVVAEWTYTAVYNRPRRTWYVYIDDLDTLTGLVVEVDGVVLTSSQYTLEMRDAVDKGKVWTRIRLSDDVTCTGDVDGVAITAQWGWTTVPTAIKEATLLQASRFLARRDSPYGIAGSPTEGSEMRLLAVVDPDVRVAVQGYVRTQVRA